MRHLSLLLCLFLATALAMGCGDDQMTPMGVNPISPSGATSATTASTSILYAVDSNADALYTINPVSGATHLIGPLDPDSGVYTTPIAMAIQPGSYDIFVWNNSDPSGVLLTVDPCTGLASPANPSTPATDIQISCLAFHSDGRLFGLDTRLFEINPTTGVPVPIGELGLRAGGADFDAGGTLYVVELNLGSEVLATVDLGTGAANVIGTLSTDIGVIGSIVFDSSGYLIGSASGSLGFILFDIDPATATVSNIRSADRPAQGLGFAPSCFAIDIKPEGDPNAINPKNRGVIPVAILGSESFDVTTVDCSTLAFGPDGASPVHTRGCHLEDVNGDGFTDLLSHFRTQETGIVSGDIQACLTGELFDGTPFEGCDAILTVPTEGVFLLGAER